MSLHKCSRIRTLHSTRIAGALFATSRWRTSTYEAKIRAIANSKKENFATIDLSIAQRTFQQRTPSMRQNSMNCNSKTIVSIWPLPVRTKPQQSQSTTGHRKGRHLMAAAARPNCAAKVGQLESHLEARTLTKRKCIREQKSSDKLAVKANPWKRSTCSKAAALIHSRGIDCGSGKNHILVWRFWTIS